jgi:hypothetical protein
MLTWKVSTLYKSINGGIMEMASIMIIINMWIISVWEMLRYSIPESSWEEETGVKKGS